MFKKFSISNQVFFFCYNAVRACKTQVILMTLFVGCQVSANPLQDFHTAALKSATQELLSATDPGARRIAIEKEIKALNSLGRSVEALDRLNVSDASVPADRRDAELRAKVLLALDRCDEAVALLTDKIKIKESITQQTVGAVFEPGGYIIAAVEELISHAYCSVRLGKFDDAVISLSRVIDPFDPATRQYTVLWYTALRAVGAKPNARMEKEVQFVSRKPSPHTISRDAIERLLSLSGARDALGKLRLEPADAQDALAELSFFIAFVDGSVAVKKDALRELNALAPYGSAEWALAKLLFQP